MRFVYQANSSVVPTEENMNDFYQIRRYLKGTYAKEIYFKKGATWNLKVHTEADWVG